MLAYLVLISALCNAVCLYIGIHENTLMNTNLSRFCKVITYYIFLYSLKKNKKCVSMEVQHHMFKLHIFFFSGRQCMIVCIILSTVYIIVYQEKYCYIYFDLF